MSQSSSNYSASDDEVFLLSDLEDGPPCPARLPAPSADQIDEWRDLARVHGTHLPDNFTAENCVELAIALAAQSQPRLSVGEARRFVAANDIFDLEALSRKLKSGARKRRSKRSSERGSDSEDEAAPRDRRRRARLSPRGAFAAPEDRRAISPPAEWLVPRRGAAPHSAARWFRWASGGATAFTPEEQPRAGFIYTEPLVLRAPEADKRAVGEGELAIGTDPDCHLLVISRAPGFVRLSVGTRDRGAAWPALGSAQLARRSALLSRLLVHCRADSTPLSSSPSSGLFRVFTDGWTAFEFDEVDAVYDCTFLHSSNGSSGGEFRSPRSDNCALARWIEMRADPLGWSRDGRAPRLAALAVRDGGESEALDGAYLQPASVAVHAAPARLPGGGYLLESSPTDTFHVLFRCARSRKNPRSLTIVFVPDVGGAKEILSHVRSVLRYLQSKASPGTAPAAAALFDLAAGRFLDGAWHDSLDTLVVAAPAGPFVVKQAPWAARLAALAPAVVFWHCSPSARSALVESLPNSARRAASSWWVVERPSGAPDDALAAARWLGSRYVEMRSLWFDRVEHAGTSNPFDAVCRAFGEADDLARLGRLLPDGSTDPLEKPPAPTARMWAVLSWARWAVVRPRAAAAPLKPLPVAVPFDLAEQEHAYVHCALRIGEARAKLRAMQPRDAAAVDANMLDLLGRLSTYAVFRLRGERPSLLAGDLSFDDRRCSAHASETTEMRWAIERDERGAPGDSADSPIDAESEAAAHPARLMHTVVEAKALLPRSTQCFVCLCEAPAVELCVLECRDVVCTGCLVEMRGLAARSAAVIRGELREIDARLSIQRGDRVYVPSAHQGRGLAAVAPGPEDAAGAAEELEFIRRGLESRRDFCRVRTHTMASMRAARADRSATPPTSEQCGCGCALLERPRESEAVLETICWTCTRSVGVAGITPEKQLERAALLEESQRGAIEFLESGERRPVVDAPLSWQSTLEVSAVETAHKLRRAVDECAKALRANNVGRAVIVSRHADALTRVRGMIARRLGAELEAGRVIVHRASKPPPLLQDAECAALIFLEPSAPGRAGLPAGDATAWRLREGVAPIVLYTPNTHEEAAALGGEAAAPRGRAAGRPARRQARAGCELDALFDFARAGTMQANCLLL
jgi:hypothetical protein